jgi:hypothetical protein
MLEKDLIQERGFKNLRKDGKVTGFQVRIRTPYYRGIWASLLEGADITVDGEEFSRDKILWTLGDRTFTLPELEAASDVRWPFEDAALLTIPKPGGLNPGPHDVGLTLAFRASYMPLFIGAWITRAQRTITLTH